MVWERQVNNFVTTKRPEGMSKVKKEIAILNLPNLIERIIYLFNHVLKQRSNIELITKNYFVTR
jgi:hypothetical protein